MCWTSRQWTVIVTTTTSYDTEKDIKGSGTIILYSIIIIYQPYVECMIFQSRLDIVEHKLSVYI